MREVLRAQKISKEGVRLLLKQTPHLCTSKQRQLQNLQKKNDQKPSLYSSVVYDIVHDIYYKY